MRRPVVIVMALVAAGCSLGGDPAPRPTPTAAPRAAFPPSCPVSSARAGDTVSLGAGRVATITRSPPALVSPRGRRELGGADALACSADARVAVGWTEGREGGTQRLRVLLEDRVLTLARRPGYDALNPPLSGVALAFAPSGELLVAFGDYDRVRARTVSLGGAVGPVVTLGKAIEYSSVFAEIAPDGRAVVAWNTLDSGLEVNRANQVFVATGGPGAAFARARRVHVGSTVDPDEGGPPKVALGVAEDGRAALLWNDVTGSYKRGGFRHPVLVAAMDGPPRRLAADGAVVDVAVRADGETLAVWTAGRQLWAAVGRGTPRALGPAEAATASFDAGRATVTTASGRAYEP